MISYGSIKGIAGFFFRFRRVDKFLKGRARIVYDFSNGEAALLFFGFIRNDETVLKRFIHCAKAWKYSIAQKRTAKEKSPDNCNRKEGEKKREYLIRYGLIRIQPGDGRSKKPGKNQQSSKGKSSCDPILEGIEGSETKIDKAFHHGTMSAVSISCNAEQTI